MNTYLRGATIRAEFELGTTQKSTNDAVGRRKVLSALVGAAEMGTDDFYDGKGLPESFAQVPALEHAWFGGHNAARQFEGAPPRIAASGGKRKLLN